MLMALPVDIRSQIVCFSSRVPHAAIGSIGCVDVHGDVRPACSFYC